MVKTVICSVGTSAAKAIGKPGDLLNWVNQQENREIAAENIFLTFRDKEPMEANLRDLSAEIHSLVRIGIDNGYRIILLASQTEDGYCCARAIKKYLKYYWTSIVTEVHQVTGLQVNNAELFRSQGVVEFVRHIIREIDQYGSENIILNPTGGYKALVPYTVLLGMLKGVKCDYIFEQSTTLLELPPLPVEFKRSQFEIYKELFEEIERESSISLQKWEEKIPRQERKFLEPLTELVDNEITLSAVGCLFLDEIRSPRVLVPFLSRKAIDDCFDDLSQLDNCDPFRYLERVATHYNETAGHINVGDGFRWLKPGRTTDRYLVSQHGWRLLVWRAIREDKEGSNYADKVKVNSKNKRAHYPFLRMEFVSLPGDKGVEDEM
ncbi:putative CRISPR-associated protein [Cylindrospermopsis raciborskii]|nr:putative CRISPR-associated protein [Cylindrospermopsis raciborskii]PNK13448.1 CRISPR-associated protein [Cylindrospermopsis raciborskii S01]